MIISYSDSFKRQLRRLNRKYRCIRADLQPLIGQLETGETPGDQTQGVDHTINKVRLKNSDAQHDKSGGYRVIYYLHTEENVLLFTIYSKTEQSDIETAELVDIIRQEKSN